MKRGKKALSPVVATVLLISIVIVIALLIFTWASGFFREAGQKLGKSEEQACREINMNFEYNLGKIYITNRGNIPVYSLKVFKTISGSTDVQDFSEENIVPGDSRQIDVGDYEYSRLEIIPIILVQLKGEKQPYTCDKTKLQVPLD